MLRPRSLGISRRQYIMLMGGLFAGCMERVAKLEGQLSRDRGVRAESKLALVALRRVRRDQLAQLCGVPDQPLAGPAGRSPS